MLFRHGANAKQVQVWLGHHSPAFTLATYVHLLPDDAPNPSFLEGFLGPSVDGGKESIQIETASRTPELMPQCAQIVSSQV
jgi:hypothetical protein